MKKINTKNINCALLARIACIAGYILSCIVVHCIFNHGIDVCDSIWSTTAFHILQGMNIVGCIIATIVTIFAKEF